MAGPSVFLSRADGDVGELLELPQGCQGNIWVAKKEFTVKDREKRGLGIGSRKY